MMPVFGAPHPCKYGIGDHLTYYLRREPNTRGHNEVTDQRDDTLTKYTGLPDTTQTPGTTCRDSPSKKK